jgi:hypothetical protein
MDLVYLATVNMCMFVTASLVCYVFYALPELYDICVYALYLNLLGIYCFKAGSPEINNAHTSFPSSAMPSGLNHEIATLSYVV